MRLDSSTLLPHVATSAFVLLWGSAAIFTRWGLDAASPMLLLIFRFSIALCLLLLIAVFRQQLFPPQSSLKKVILTGFLMIGGYSICYFQAMAHGVTPGLIATIMGIQPILTLCLLERKMNSTKLLGLSIALAGLIFLVWDSLSAAHIAPIGIGLALLALCCMTFGAIIQKDIHLHPAQVLPLQYMIGLLCCLFMLPFENIQINFNLHFIAAVLFLGILISVIAQFLLYKLLNSKNIVNVTSLFYLVPVVTALLDYWLLDNRLAWSACMGMLAIITGIIIVFHAPKKI